MTRGADGLLRSRIRKTFGAVAALDEFARRISKASILASEKLAQSNQQSGCQAGAVSPACKWR